MPNPLLVEDLHDLATMAVGSGKAIPPKKWVTELRHADEEAGLEGFVP